MKLFLFVIVISLIFSPFVSGNDNPVKPIDQKPLFDLFENADKIVVNKVRKNIRVIFFESKNIKDLADLKQSIELKDKNPNPNCKCNNKNNAIAKGNGDEGCDYSIQLFKDNKETVEIEIFNGCKISCNLWDQKASIGNLEKWYAWFDEHKIPRPTKEFGAFNKEHEMILDNRHRWLEGMPSSIRTIFVFPVPPLFKLMEINTLLEPLKKEFPNQNKRILALLNWYGSGAGSWSKSPIYEGIAEKMLAEYKASDVAKAIESARLTDTQKEGAVRYFSIHYNGLADKRNINELKAPTQELLWNYVKVTKDEDKLVWAKKAFKK